MKTRTTTLLLITSLAALGGCSHSADQVPDYHTLVGPNNSAKLDAARKECKKSSTLADAMTNPWCAAVKNADDANDKLMTSAKY